MGIGQHLALALRALEQAQNDYFKEAKKKGKFKKKE